MRLRLVALCGVVVAFLVAGGTAGADSGTFSGSITPTACGPLHPITVVAGETTIDAVANMDVAANDITLDLYDPSGALKAHGDRQPAPKRSSTRATTSRPGSGTCRSAPSRAA